MQIKSPWTILMFFFFFLRHQCNRVHIPQAILNSPLHLGYSSLDYLEPANSVSPSCWECLISKWPSIILSQPALEATKKGKSNSALTFNISEVDFPWPKEVCLSIYGEARLVFFPVFVGHVLKSTGGASVQRIGSLKDRGKTVKKTYILLLYHLNIFKCLHYSSNCQSQFWKLFE